jgi:hypothetical protein
MRVLALALIVLAASAGTAGAATGHRHVPLRTAVALRSVDRLVVKGRGPMTGYSREQFGSEWADVDHNGCDTRDDMLRRDLTDRTTRPGTHGCVITSGTVVDPYTGTRIRYVRGGGDEVDIDHVVSLGDAWQKGAPRWTSSERTSFANDPLNLLAVSAHANRQKGDSDAATWLPPDKSYRCRYVARQLAVKLKYGLSATLAERDAMRRILTSCPTLRLPESGASPNIPVALVSAPKPPAPSSGKATAGVRVFRNCTAARAAGVTPILRGTPLYDANTKLDRDKDGVACE